MDLKQNHINQLKQLMRNSAEKGNLPNGALALEDGKVIASEESLVASENDATAHAELKAVSNVCNSKKSMWTPDLELVTVTEPCLMCLSACSQAGYDSVYYLIPASKFENEVLYLNDVEGFGKQQLVKNFTNSLDLTHLENFEQEFSKLFKQVLPDQLKKER